MKINDFACAARLFQSALLCLRRHFGGFHCWRLTAENERQREKNSNFSVKFIFYSQTKWLNPLCETKDAHVFATHLQKFGSHIFVGPPIVRQRQYFHENKQCIHKLFICMTNQTHFGRCYLPSLARHDNTIEFWVVPTNFWTKLCSFRINVYVSIKM